MIKHSTTSYYPWEWLLKNLVYKKVFEDDTKVVYESKYKVATWYKEDRTEELVDKETTLWD